MDANKLSVNTEELTTYAQYLVGTKKDLNDQLDDLKKKMDTISEGWSDQDGIAFQASFAKFIEEARKISDETGKLGEFAKKESDKYDSAITKALKKFGESSG